MTAATTTPADKATHEPKLTRRIAAPPAAVLRAWTAPALREQGFGPRPWRVQVS
ncbi:hypothetical protein [Sphaerotilus microaerophilus]|uniref:Uncharacterized protein n=1 Tax=Sphaerotilus microaerophilus TaxID=2914710 RepID=A0ABN6PGN8_9BURK|nr:hypothetical protein [Sphaerotilus sp. FB-5]BDI03169.1 hypothetical protein CATMQ487_01390 [Sphaerotilus sp. FB-5]